MNKHLTGSFFLLSLVLTGYLYGVASAQWNWQPYPAISEAFRAFHAWKQVLNSAPADHFAPFARFERDESLLQRAWPYTGDAEAGRSERILITGGPHRLTEHCPRFGCLAWITDRSGKILHYWEVDLGSVLTDRSNISGRTDAEFFVPWGLNLNRDGSLLAVIYAAKAHPYQYGIIKIDRNGTVLWRRHDLSHHWLDVDETGNSYVPGMRLISSPMKIGTTLVELHCPAGRIIEDMIRVLSPDGELVREISVPQALAKSGYAGLLDTPRDRCDPTHLNSVEVIPTQIASRLPAVQTGDLLISLRASNTIAIIGSEEGQVRHLVSGKFLGQHSPHLLPDGRILLLDNWGGSRSTGGSQVVSLDITTGEVDLVFPGIDTAFALFPIYTETNGHLDISPDGRRALVSLFDQGRTLEFDIETGAVLWRHSNVHRIPQRIRQQLGSPEEDRQLVRFKAVGAYYVRDVSFLDDTGPAAGIPQ